MHEGQTVFAQLFEFISHNEFRRCVARYDGNRRVRRLACWEQFLAMAFAQLTARDSLRDIEVCLAAQRRNLYHCGFRHAVKRSTLAEANEQRDWRIYADFAQTLIAHARPLYADEDLGLELDATLYALDATTIDLCLALFPWAHFRRTKAAVKLHTLLDLRGSIPAFLDITHGKVHDVTVLDQLLYDPGAYLIMDRGYLDFAASRDVLCHSRQGQPAVPPPLLASRRQAHRRPQRSNHCADRPPYLAALPRPLGRVSYYAAEIDKRFVFLTNNFTLAAETVAALYRCRWQVELFFKWIKQHLRIKRFFGTSANSVKTQVWIAVAVYVLVAIIKKQLHLPHSLYTILQVFSLTLFEKIPISRLFQRFETATDFPPVDNQLNLFDH